MARKITQEVGYAFNWDKSFSGGNTTIEVTDSLTRMLLHGEEIAVKHRELGEINITNAGYFTQVTKNRLNSINGVDIRQIKGVWYLNDEEWDGEWIIIKLR